MLQQGTDILVQDMTYWCKVIKKIPLSILRRYFAAQCVITYEPIWPGTGTDPAHHLHCSMNLCLSFQALHMSTSQAWDKDRAVLAEVRLQPQHWLNLNTLCKKGPIFWQWSTRSQSHKQSMTMCRRMRGETRQWQTEFWPCNAEECSDASKFLEQQTSHPHRTVSDDLPALISTLQPLKHRKLKD